jgi:hypothetical protein
LYIQGDPLGASFKVANIGGLLGAVDQDTPSSSPSRTSCPGSGSW